MKHKETVKEELRRKLEESFQESMREHEVDKMTEGVFKIFDESNLSPIEKFGVLEIIRHYLHKEVEYMCEEDQENEVDEQTGDNIEVC
jgi:hypothetical protein